MFHSIFTHLEDYHDFYPKTRAWSDCYLFIPFSLIVNTEKLFKINIHY